MSILEHLVIWYIAGIFSFSIVLPMMVNRQAGFWTLRIFLEMIVYILLWPIMFPAHLIYQNIRGKQ